MTMMMTMIMMTTMTMSNVHDQVYSIWAMIYAGEACEQC